MRGEPLPAGPWSIEEPAFPHGPTLREELTSSGIPVAESAVGSTVQVIAVMSRLPQPETEIERLRAACRARPTALVGLQNDTFLDRVPEAALRISASDATPLTRRVVARRLAKKE